MTTLKKQISRYMYTITSILIVIIVLSLMCIQIFTERNRAYNEALVPIQQIESLLYENQKEAEEAYRQTCLHNAETVARIVEIDPSVLDNVEELQRIAISVEVDEIHFFDTSGSIFSGTHPEFYGYTFDSGEQIQFFKPMLEDKSLQLIQNITPNSAESKLMQYSAIWAKNGEYIVQIGMKPETVHKATERNNLSDIFASLRINPDTDYYAINHKTLKIIGSTDSDTVGLTADEIGINPSTIHNKPEGFHAKVNNEWSYCVFKQVGSYCLGRIITAESLYQRVPTTVFGVSIGFVLLSLALAQSVILYMNKYVVHNIEALNQKLNSVANGNENEIFDIGGSEEFTKLNQYITVMIKNLMDHSKKMSYALSKTNVHIGIYEYGSHLKKMQYTEYIPIIFSINELKMDYFSKHPTEFQTFLDNIKKNPINLEEDIYQYKDRYIRLEEIENGDEIFGVVMDVTEQTQKRMKIEQERDIDTLTGLFNRRGLDNCLIQLFSKPEKLGHSAIFMIDADGLKGINDTYGHEKGDIYLKKIGETISVTGTRHNVASRQGGDEFVLYLYGYEHEEELVADIQAIDAIRDNTLVELDTNIQIPLRFSLGYSLIKEDLDYQALLKRADEMMYQNKLNRRKQ